MLEGKQLMCLMCGVEVKPGDAVWDDSFCFCSDECLGDFWDEQQASAERY